MNFWNLWEIELQLIKTDFCQILKLAAVVTLETFKYFLLIFT